MTQSTNALQCMYCMHRKPFKMPAKILQAAKQGSLVIFAGAGVSTEVSSVFPENIYKHVRDQIKTVPNSEEFPDVMSSYEAEFGRAELIRTFWTRFDYIRSFWRLESEATKFHRELATMPYIHEVITTNWDRYFEDYCGAIPIVSGDDYALHSIEGRKVYKIHGSMSSLASIIATRADYEACLERLSKSALGGTLRHILATKTVVFVGYSLADSDFVSIFRALTSDMGTSKPTYFGVSPICSVEASNLGIKQIETDGTFFLHKVKEKMTEENCFLPDTVYDNVDAVVDSAREARSLLQGISHQEHPGVLYANFYLDGIQDAYDRVQANRCRGDYSDAHSVQQKVHSYKKLQASALERNRYDDFAYIEGYMNVLIYLLVNAPDMQLPPPFFCFTHREIRSIEDFMKAVRNLKRRNHGAWLRAKRISDELPEGLTMQHTPFLDGLG